MKKVVVTVFTILLLTSCNNNGERLLSESSGNINSLSIVIDNELWQGSVGEKIRSILGAAVYGLPQDEPLFTMHQNTGSSIK